MKVHKQEAISPRLTPGVIACSTLGAAAFSIPGALIHSWWGGLTGLILGGVAGVLGLIDARTHRLPNKGTYPLVAFLCVAVLIGAATGHSGTQAAFLSGLGSALFLLILAVASGGGLGLGDVKLSASLGMWSGWLTEWSAITFVAASFILGGLVAVALMVTRRANRRSHLAFGPFLILGAAVASWTALL